MAVAASTCTPEPASQAMPSLPGDSVTGGPLSVYLLTHGHLLSPFSESSVGNDPFSSPPPLLGLRARAEAPPGVVRAPPGRAGGPGSGEATCLERTGLRFLFPVWPGKGPAGGAGSWPGLPHVWALVICDFGPQSSLCGDLGRGLLGWGKEKTRDVCGGPSRTDLPSILKPSWQTCLFPICGAIRTKGHLGRP